MLRSFFAALIMISFSSILWAQTESEPIYRPASDDKDNVKLKLFTKKSRIELNLPDFGLIINQPLIRTYLLHGGINYYWSEVWGIGLEGSYGMNENKSERDCLETFYNDPTSRVESSSGRTCSGGDSGQGNSDLNNTDSNYGPAYMPIREIKYIVAVNGIWNPIYGKQLLLLSATSYFDVFFTVGGGLVFSDFYEKTTTLRNGKKSRATYKSDSGSLDGGANTNEEDSYGEAGRPDPVSQTNPFLNLGIGQKYHFLKRFSVKFEFRNMTLLGTPGGFENLFAIWTGFGMRL